MSSSASLDSLRQRAARDGFNLLGLVDAEEFDRSQPRGRRACEQHPGCRTILVLATGGSAFWHGLVAAEGEPGRPRPGYHPIDRRSRRVAWQVASSLGSNGHAGRTVFPGDPTPLNFLQLAEMAGLGTISPVIGMLLHPDYGPWVSLRAAILVEGRPFGSSWKKPVPPGFQPCLSCSKPCVRACPAGVYDGDGGMSLETCGRHRHAGGCAGGCEVRRACPVGAEHRYGPEEEAFRHQYSLFTMRRYFGLGAWRMVPEFVRRALR